MKKTTLLLAMIIGLTISQSNAATFPKATETVNNSYTINDDDVEALFANSTELDLNTISSKEESLNLFGTTTNANSATFKKASSGKSAIAAIVIDFFVGGLGIHRAYLGTKTFTWIGYILTCGGIFGIVPLVDFIVLIVNANNISQFENNSKFFMW
ncbi:MAG TPA: TM2 domain-containing protein [Chitinophagaceae bacterium]|jgi:TM2 domain-containing membrane protein YozV|nr:TM2 domain-containing protein [Chitinophagaceae bacterium]